MQQLMGNKSGIRARVVILCLMSAAGIYLSITHHAFAIAVFALNLVSLFFLNEQEIFWQMLFLLPFTMVYKRSPASSSMFTYLNVLVVGKLLIKNLNFSKEFVAPLILFISVTLVGARDDMMSFVKIISNVFLLMFFVKFVRRENFSKMVISISLGEVIASFIGLQKTSWTALSAFFSDLNEEYIGGKQIARFTGLYLDPNYYSIIVIICLFSLLLYMYKKEIDYKIGMPLFVALVIFGCKTYSRVFYIALVCVLLAIVVIRLKNNSVISTLMLIMLFGGVIIFIAEQSGFIDNIMYRFHAKDVSNGRFDIWKNYIKVITDNAKILLIGTGLGADLRGMGGSHNFYIESLYHMGIIGTAIYYYLLCTVMKTRTFPLFRRSVVNWSLTCVLMIMFATLGMLFQFDFIYILMLDWMILNTNMTRIEN